MRTGELYCLKDVPRQVANGWTARETLRRMCTLKVRCRLRFASLAKVSGVVF